MKMLYKKKLALAKALKCISICMGVLCVSSCNQTESIGTTILLTEENMPRLDTLYLEKIDLNETILDAYSFVHKNLIISINSSHPNPYFLTVTNLSGEIIAEYYKKGKGPEEFIGVVTQLHNNQLLIYDPSAKKIVRMDIDSIASLKYDYHPKISTISTSINRGYAFTNETSITAYNIGYLAGMTTDPTIPEYIHIDVKTGICDSIVMDPRFFAGGVTGGQLVYSSKENIYMMAFTRRPQIDMLDKNLNKIKTYVGPEENDVEFELIDKWGNLREKGGKLSFFFESSTISENNIFFINSRTYKVAKPDYRKNEAQYYVDYQEIWRFNSKGDFINRYKVPNTYGRLFAPSYCEETKTLYVNGYDEDGELCLYKCSLK
ncbi:MAG: hypothetical protein J6Y72_10835 [Bacteroidales bacterium]|nr:hypothetical protein [Bacteroidales bacterium]